MLCVLSMTCALLSGVVMEIQFILCRSSIWLHLRSTVLVLIQSLLFYADPETVTLIAKQRIRNFACVFSKDVPAKCIPEPFDCAHDCMHFYLFILQVSHFCLCAYKGRKEKLGCFSPFVIPHISCHSAGLGHGNCTHSK